MFRKLILLFLCFKQIHSNSTDADAHKDNSSFRIVNGYRCSVKNHPYMIGIAYAYTGYVICGGSLLSSFWAVTARHCVDYCIRPKEFAVISGAERIEKEYWGKDVQISMVDTCYKHSTIDFALLNLETPITASKTTGYIKLATNLDVLDGSLTDICANSTVMGWGYQTVFDLNNNPIEVLGHKNDPYLQCLQIPVISKKECNEQLKAIYNAISDPYFCAFKPNADACMGDSGGPLICNGIQYGVVSSGFGCAYKNYPGLYVDVRHLESFITSVIDQVNEMKTLEFNNNQNCDFIKRSFMVSIVHRTNFRRFKFVCSGSMLAEKWVLSAGRCKSNCKLLTVIGGWRNSNCTNPHDNRTLWSDVENCFQATKKSSAFDILLLKLKKGFKASDELSFVRFATSIDALNMNFEDACRHGKIIGYERQKRDELVRNLECTKVSVTSQTRCRKKWNTTEIGDQHGCVVVEKVKSCVENLGAPLICHSGILYGVLVSTTCDESSPILIAKVHEYNTFLDNIIMVRSFKNGDFDLEKSKGIFNNSVDLYIIIFSVLCFIM